MIDYRQRPQVRPFGQFSIDCPDPVMLPNGVPMYVVAGTDQQVTRVNVLHRGGFMEEPPHRLAAQATAMQLQQGTGQMSSQEIAECFDYNGAFFGAKASHNHTSVSLNVLNRCLPATLPVMRDMVLAPSFPERELQVLRNRSLGLYRTSRERVKYLAAAEMSRIFFGPRYPSPAISDEQIMALSRQQLLQFHQQYFRPANRVVILSGCIADREIAMAADAFGSDTDGQLSPSPFSPITQHPSSEHFAFVEKPGAVQSGVMMQLPAVLRDHPDYFNLRILTTVLGGYFGSRLMANIREEKGYTYGIDASILCTLSDAYIKIYSECDCAHTMPLVDEVKKELARLRNELIPAAELEIVRSTMLSDLVRNLDTPFALASCVSAMVLYGIHPQYYNRQIAAIRAATPEALLETARRYLTEDNLYTAIAGQK